MAARVGLAGRVGLALASALAAACPGLRAGDPDHEWRNWRGPLQTGVAPHARPPVAWSETNHVRWRVPVPGQGHASPIVAGDRVVLMYARPVGPAQEPVRDRAPGVHDDLPVTHRHAYGVAVLRRSDGAVLWDRVVREEWPHEGGHVTGSPASASPVTDGNRIYAHFGSRGLFALEADGRVAWTNALGRMQTLHAHGEGSSPLLHDGTLYVNWDHEAGSFVAALDARDGRVRWKVPRDEPTSWSTPVLVGEGDARQVVVSATRRIRAYDPRDGRLVWECAGLTDNVVSTPVPWRDLVIAGNSYVRQAMVAVRWKGASGDVTSGPNVAWRSQRMPPYVPSPLVHGDTLYFLRHNQNILSRVDPATGQPRAEPLRLSPLGDLVFSSPVAADGRLYVTGRDGVTVVLGLSEGNPLLAVNRLDDVFSATAAPAGDALYLRGERFLYCLADAPTPRSTTP